MEPKNFEINLIDSKVQMEIVKSADGPVRLSFVTEDQQYHLLLGLKSFWEFSQLICKSKK